MFENAWTTVCPICCQGGRARQRVDRPVERVTEWQRCTSVYCMEPSQTPCSVFTATRAKSTQRTVDLCVQCVHVPLSLCTLRTDPGWSRREWPQWSSVKTERHCEKRTPAAGVQNQNYRFWFSDLNFLWNFLWWVTKTSSTFWMYEPLKIRKVFLQIAARSLDM